MSATERSRRRGKRPLIAQAGTTAVEFALLASTFFTFVFGIVEVARLLYVYNTLQEVTRRAAAAAASVYPRDTAATDRVRYHAVFRQEPGGLLLAPPVTDGHIRLAYLNAALAEIPRGQWPASAAANKQVCMINPRAANCIRFVQAQVCDDADMSDCARAESRMLLPIIDLRVPLPRATTIATVESLGYVPGTRPPACPCV